MTEETLYYITNGVAFVSDNGAAVVQKIEDASYWRSRQSASNVLRECRKRKTNKLDKNWYVCSREETRYSITVQDEELKEMLYIIERMFPIIEMTSNLESLKLDLSTVDRKISDIEHFIEFTEQNACNGYKLYKQLKDLRKERRVLKDKLHIIRLIAENGFTVDTILQIRNHFDGKMFTPKELTLSDILG